MQGELLKDLWKKQSRILDWNGNGMLDYVLVEGEESHFDAIRRTSGFLETGAELPLNRREISWLNGRESWLMKSLRH